jgi:DNA (cytosine-5)-methyltransferase 1
MKKVNLSTAAQILDTPPATILSWHKKKLIKGERYNSGNWLFNPEELIAMKQSYQGEKAVAKFTTLKSPDRTNFKVMELFAGCGGLALGLENAGLETQLLVEIDKDCVNTLNLNRPNWQTINDDVTKINFAEFTNQIDILAGGFPCQSFSYAGLGKGLEDTRGTLFFQFARCLQTIRPKIALAENVRGLLSHKKGETLAIMLNTFRDLGYYPVYRLLSSQFLDVPQKRERLIILATRNDLQIKPIFPQEKNYTISLRQALEDCPESDGMAYNQRKKTVMNLVPPGGNW